VAIMVTAKPRKRGRKRERHGKDRKRERERVTYFQIIIRLNDYETHVSQRKTSEIALIFRER